MALSLAFDKTTGQNAALQLSNNLKLAFAQELADAKVKLTVNTDATTPELTVSGSEFRLFNANAILRYVLDDFEGVHSQETHYAVSSLEAMLYHPNAPQVHIQETVTKALENYLTDLQETPCATRLITFANVYALSPSMVESKFKEMPVLFSSAITIAKSKCTRTSFNAKHTGAVKIDTNFAVKKPSGEILPKDGERNILITSALPYVNNVPHLGNIVGSVLSADIYARYCKAKNYNTLFVCGTDEYGTATETKALEEKCSPQELCDKYHKIHKEVYDWFQIGFDHFGRTTTEQQTDIAQGIFKNLENNGFLEEHSMKQLYCEVHKAYLADRYVEGTCPKCSYEDARGDQCDKCGALLDPFELIDPRCKLDGSTPLPRFSDHVFLSLDKLEPRIKAWVEKSSTEGGWSKNSKTITNSWLKEGLQPRCITRDLVWGTQVPMEKYKDKVLYVWFDAPIGYVSITANYTKGWEKWWKNPQNVDLYQFMGKDNVPFHTVIFPGSQLGTGEDWTMLHHLSTTEYLQYEGGKFSKSRGVGVFGNNAKETGVSPSVWRYYLASIRPESSDSHFSWNDFVARNNSELLANLGNFVNRLVKFVNAKYNGVVPEFDTNHLVDFKKVEEDLNTILVSYNTEMEQSHERRGLELAMALSARGNLFLQDNKLDNTLFSESPDKSDAVVGVGLNIIYAVTSLIYPFMPETAEIIYRMLNAPELRIGSSFNLCIQGGHNINKAEYLFKRIDEKEIDQWRSKYGGQHN
ncbi:LANO_0C08548g1_1 [Lachancea nothofagi CBS 11611]|uniref:methionine--tRNA ligase n=1 Tax=Lachancea nothofagi CBS 11611 TaxID=1266666 RepID=A0A1G4J9P0_9SACH|nr:LANO_0C08548g1_1 [Lachancea nothofagi CBS 11611]